jgi:hypothetical protein
MARPPSGLSPRVPESPPSVTLGEQKVREIIARGEDKKYERVYRLLQQAEAAHMTRSQPAAERSSS